MATAAGTISADKRSTVLPADEVNGAAVVSGHAFRLPVRRAVR